MGFIRKHKILIAILGLAAILRLWDLANTPPHLTSDEASLGYNAYSILKTGKDEHGELLPIIFKSFGDWKPGLYIYLTAPSVAIFGLNEFSTRLPGAISGVIAVFLLYLLGQELFKNKRLGLISAFFLAISPWHVQFSRGAWEAGVSLSLTLAGIYFFLRGVKNNNKAVLVSIIFFALTLWTYQGAKLSTGIVVLGLFLCFKKEFLSLPRNIIVKSFLIGLLVSTPVLFSLLQGKAGRLKIFSVFSYRRPEEVVNDILSQDGVGKNSWQYVLYHSEALNLARGVLGRWFNHFSGRFLFFEGDWANARHGVPNTGVILLADVVFLISGLIALAKMGSTRSTVFIWYWLVFAPIPAALSRDSIHAVRSLNMVVPLTIVLAIGADCLWNKVKRLGKFLPLFYRAAASFAYILCSIFYILNYIYYLDAYWVHAPKRNSRDWYYGYKQIVDKVTKLQNKYSEIVIKQDYAQPYIFFLFYQKYDPAKYQKVVKDVYMSNQYGDVGLVSRIDNITFRDINWSADRGMSGKLFIVDPIKVPIEDSNDPKQFRTVDEIKYLDGQTAFRFIQIQ